MQGMTLHGENVLVLSYLKISLYKIKCHDDAKFVHSKKSIVRIFV